MSTPPIGCSGCDARWGGLLTGHCSGCHLTFSGISAFDMHRKGLHTQRRYCAEPSTVGLVLSGRDYQCWGFPGSYEREDDK